MDIMQTGTVLAIVVITFLIGYACKVIPGVKDELIPVIVGVCGGLNDTPFLAGYSSFLHEKRQPFGCLSIFLLNLNIIVYSNG